MAVIKAMGIQEGGVGPMVREEGGDGVGTINLFVLFINAVICNNHLSYIYIYV